ncbi:hypothetical protein [Helicobacter sp. 23-1045]
MKRANNLKNSPPPLRSDSHFYFPLPCGGGLRGWVDSANAESVKLSCEAPLISPASWCKKSD